MFDGTGLRKSDLPSFIPWATVSALLVAAIGGYTWRALRDLVPYRVCVDRERGLVVLTGARPLSGLVTETIPIRQIRRVIQRRVTYRSITTFRIVLQHAEQSRTVMFNLLGEQDWERIRQELRLAGVPNVP